MNETSKTIMVTHDWGMTDEDFFKRIDEQGGWPSGFKYVSFYHTVASKNRPCEFSNNYRRDEWWTTICEADDYYMYKLSPEALNKIEKGIRYKIAREISNGY